MRRAAWAAPAVIAAIILVLVLSRRGGHGDVREEAPVASLRSTRPAAPAAPAPLAVPTAVDDAAIGQLLGEELVPVASTVTIAELAADQPQPCAGREVLLRSRLAGDAAQDRLVSRWIWATSERLSMQPGATARFTAPAPGRYPIRFQLVRSLGGARIGVLAERTLELDVADCGSGPAPLQVTSTVLGGRADFTVLATVPTQGGYAWDFGDGDRQTTDRPTARHDYPIIELRDREVRSYQVSVEVDGADGTPLRATTEIVLRGQVNPPLPPAIAAELGDPSWDEHDRRWRRQITVDNRERPAITWERGERHTQYDDKRIASRNLTVAELLAITEQRQAGGFVATVTVTDAETGPGVRRITDRLFGHDAAGEEASLTWVAWDREDFEPDPVPPRPPRR